MSDAEHSANGAWTTDDQAELTRLLAGDGRGDDAMPDLLPITVGRPTLHDTPRPVLRTPDRTPPSSAAQSAESGPIVRAAQPDTTSKAPAVKPDVAETTPPRAKRFTLGRCVLGLGIATIILVPAGIKLAIDTTPPLTTSKGTELASPIVTPAPKSLKTPSKAATVLASQAPTPAAESTPSITVTAGPVGVPSSTPESASPSPSQPPTPTETAPAPVTPTETTVTIPDTIVSMATFNVEHIGNDSQQEWMGRMHQAVQLLYGTSEDGPDKLRFDENSAIDVVAMQEMRPEQVQAFAEMTKGVYDFYPNPAKGEPYSPNIVAWRIDHWAFDGPKDTPRPQIAGSYDFLYFHGVTMTAPIVPIINVQTGAKMKASAGHNPADTVLNGEDNQGLRDIDNNIEKRVFTRQNEDPDTADMLGIDGNEGTSVDPHDQYNEPLNNDPKNLIGCDLAGPNGPFETDAFGTSRGMTPEAMCADKNATSGDGPDYVDHLFAKRITFKWLHVISPSTAGSDHEVLVEGGVIPAHTVLVAATGGNQ